MKLLVKFNLLFLTVMLLGLAVSGYVTRNLAAGLSFLTVGAALSK